MKRAKDCGFTAVEMLVVISIVGLALGASWGSVRDLMEQNRVNGAANQLATHLRLARERSVAEGNNIIVTFRTAQNNYQIWDDEGSDALLGPDDSRRTHQMPVRVALRNPSFFGANRVIFRADGTTDATGSVEVLSGASARRIDVLASTGKVTVSIP
jgi:prepilin-type N-terminal cleavage/methylation domain-containing protein